MLLTIDIGNTNIKMGLYQDEQLVTNWRMQTQRFRLTDEYAVTINSLLSMSGLDMTQISGCAISCVVPPLTEQFADLATRYLRVEPVMVCPETHTGLRFDVETPPHEMGSDRIANSLAAHHRYPGPVIAIAFGTATAFDVITSDGVYIGGAIAPGIGISAEALFRTAARLYQVELKRPPRTIAKNTINFMQSGLIIGYAGLVEGLVERMQKELGESCTVVATGGLAEVIAGETQAITVVEPYLTLEGLRLIYNMNRPPELEDGLHIDTVE
jgi:type III pantothenate kinase